jgi:hypothetical protein
MASHERRIAPRKSYAIPVRFNVITEPYAMVGVAGAATVPAHANAKLLSTIALPQHDEIVNLSERGIGFKTRQNRNVGENVEVFFTLPTALTARAGRRTLQRASGACGEGSGDERNDGYRRGHWPLGAHCSDAELG